jgi:hypothetical protein
LSNKKGVNKNPWPALPEIPPYVLSDDKAAVSDHNDSYRHDSNYHLELRALPEPFVGSTQAPVVLLNLNPGFDVRNIAEHALSQFQSAIRGNYRQENTAFPFYYLDPALQGSGREWWTKKLRFLLSAPELDPGRIARSILVVEYFPYHSKGFRRMRLGVPSQKFGFSLVLSAISRGAIVVIMRAKQLWMEAVPELATYSNTYTLNSPQNVVVSPGNCLGFEAVRVAIRSIA